MVLFADRDGLIRLRRCKTFFAAHITLLSYLLLSLILLKGTNEITHCFISSTQLSQSFKKCVRKMMGNHLHTQNYFLKCVCICPLSTVFWNSSSFPEIEEKLFWRWNQLGRFSAILYKEATSITSCLLCCKWYPKWKGESTQKGKNLLPWGANSSLL